MPPRRTFAVAALLAALPLAVAPAGAQSVPPDTPLPPYERLAFFEGTWTVADTPPERQFRETCAWMEGGRRHMVCRTRSRTASGQWREGISMFSYRASDSTYLYYGLRSGGATDAQAGHATADGWRFSGESGTGAARRRVRVTITGTPEGFLLVEDTATGDGPFEKAGEVRYIRLKPEPAR